MKIHYHRINERGEHRWAKGFWHYTRHFWHFYPRKNKNSIDFNLEFAFRTKIEWWTALVWYLSIGNKGSETPWDGHISILGQSIFWSFSRGRRLADFLTSRKQKYTSREIRIGLRDQAFEFVFWANKNEWSRKFKDRGLSFKIPLNLVELIWGAKYFNYETIDKWKGYITFDEGVYPVELELQSQTIRRRKRKNKVYDHKFVVEVEAFYGIPSHYDSSAGFKGDRTYGFSVDFPYQTIPPQWWIPASNLVRAWVYKERGRTNFTKPEEVNEPDHKAAYYASINENVPPTGEGKDEG